MAEKALFKKVNPVLDFPKEERAILALWKEKRIFEKSLEAHASPGEGAGTFVFYEGPPTANGLPHNGHVLTRVIKDLFPRYKTMRGYRVPRKAGWDTHGLPVEVEVEKELRIHGKAAIEQYGVEPFVRRCIESVFRYTSEWAQLTERVAFWVDLKDAYVTYHRSYVESVWWALSQLFQKGLLYQGHKVVWWWAQGGTALSSAEVGLGYRAVDDPSAYVAFPLEEKLGGVEAALLVWTTTPWTLSSNMYAAVNPQFDYVRVKGKDEARFVVAKALLEPLAKKLGCDLVIEDEMKGAALIGRAYAPPFALYQAEAARLREKTGFPLYTVQAADFVALDTGTGIVHIAPAFGEDDYKLHAALGKGGALAPAPLCAVKPDGTFIPEMGKYAGRWVKDCDKEILHELKERHLLVHHEQYRHDYPFCWRADEDPLIQYARPAWYIRTTALIDQAIANNQAIHWLPDHIKEGRFGDFLANNVDWALSRERFWGTPLNVWICDRDPKHMEAPDSVAAIEVKNPRAFDHFAKARAADPSLSEHLIVHKPWIDAVTFPCKCGGTMNRVPEVIDCWFDSGCMPFAQWGYPHQGEARFKESFPADFISEAIDQTRGWFYSLLMISTLVFDAETQAKLGMRPTPFPYPFKTCIVLGHVGDKEGKKESKSKGNYTPPEVILDRVAMDFAVTDAESAGLKGPAPAKGTALVCREDLEGLDLQDGATARVFRAGAKEDGDAAADFKITAGKGMRRRVVVLHPDDVARLGVTLTKTKDVKPVEVPRLPAAERLTVLDTASQAPGADAFRWFFYASNPPWSNTRHSLSNVRALQKEFLIKLRNVYSFFVIYANIDGAPPKGAPAQKSELDRWILSELALTTRGVTADLDAYDVYRATQRLTALVDALSNWYVRRSRDRFWRSGWEPDKVAAHETLFEVLVTTSKLIAPFVPYLADAIYQNLVVGSGAPSKESVHLELFPAADPSAIDDALSRQMAAIREIVSVGLKVRTDHKLKVRQPLRRAHVVLNDSALRHEIARHKAMVLEELNVLDVNFVDAEEAERFGAYSYKPNFRSLGQRGLGKAAQEWKKAWAQLSADNRRVLDAVVLTGKGTFRGTEVVREDVEAAFETKAGFAAAGDRVGVVILETTLDDELRDLGLYRELLNRIQTARKEMELEYTDRIHVTIGGSERAKRVALAHADELARETLAVSVTAEAPATSHSGELREMDIEGEAVSLFVARA